MGILVLSQLSVVMTADVDSLCEVLMFKTCDDTSLHIN